MLKSGIFVIIGLTLFLALGSRSEAACGFELLNGLSQQLEAVEAQPITLETAHNYFHHGANVSGDAFMANPCSDYNRSERMRALAEQAILVAWAEVLPQRFAPLYYPLARSACVPYLHANQRHTLMRIYTSRMFNFSEPDLAPWVHRNPHFKHVLGLFQMFARQMGFTLPLSQNAVEAEDESSGRKAYALSEHLPQDISRLGCIYDVLNKAGNSIVSPFDV